MTNPIQTFCSKNKISLTGAQRRQALRYRGQPLTVNTVYSSYKTLEGRVFYVRANQRDFFIHLFTHGGYRLENGWDGGNLGALSVVREYYNPKKLSLSIDYQGE